MADALHTPGSIVQAVEARLDDGGLLTPLGPGAMDIRTGVMAGPGSTAIVTGTSATGTMTVSIAPHHWVTSRGSASGPYRGAREAATTVNIAAAPATGSRIDVVYVKQQDSTSGVPSPDVTTAPLYGVLQGTAGSSPTKPSLSSIAGAEELATVQVAAGATSTNGANVTITNTARQTVARGGIVPVLAGDTGSGAYYGQWRHHPTYGPQWWDGSKWRGVIPVALSAVSADSTLYTVSHAVMTLSVPDPGHSYRLLCEGSVLLSVVGAGVTVAAYVQVNGTTVQPVGADIANPGGTSLANQLAATPSNGLSGILTGASTVTLFINKVGTAGNGFAATASSLYNSLTALVLPA